MVTHRNITKIISVIVAAAVLLCILAMAFPEKVVETFGGTGVALRYETELFDTDELIRIDIQMDEEKWEEMLANASAEEYYSCDVVINGTKLRNVGVRPKGNTSLSSIVMDPDTDRFSLKVEFDRYVEGQTCFGLDKLILNNNYADATNMKEALVYDMYGYLGTDASLYNYAEVCVNGQYWGVYLALEAVEDSFLLRNYGTEDGKLYKPENMGMGDGAGRGGPGGQRPPFDGDGGGFESQNPWEADGQRRDGGENGLEGEGNPPPDMEDGSVFRPQGLPGGNGEEAAGGDDGTEGEEPSDEMRLTERAGLPDGGELSDRGKGPGRGGMPGGGPSMGGGGADLNYTDDDLDSYSTIWEGEVTDTGKNDHRRVVTALKNISEGTDPERYLDVDNLLKYMAVHVFSVNMDSLSGVMAHNYYLYEHNGQLNILPWDYNLSFGGMGMGMGSDASGVINDAIDTPFQATEFFDVLLENEEYLARYHEYLEQLVEEYVFGGKFEEFYNRVRNQIDPLAETDPTAFYSFEEYQAGAEMLYKTVMLRGESIRGQLEGTIPSTDEGQRADSLGLIDASSIDIDIMGTFNRGRQDAGGNEDGFPGRGQEFGRRVNQEAKGESEQEENEAQEAFNGEAVTAGKGNGVAGGPNQGNMPGGPPQGFGAFEGGDMPGGPGSMGSENVVRNLAVLGVCLMAAVAALFMAKHYQRIPRRK